MSQYCVLLGMIGSSAYATVTDRLVSVDIIGHIKDKVQSKRLGITQKGLLPLVESANGLYRCKTSTDCTGTQAHKLT
jgi:hypothetical protein